jgi:hypothetical protein
LSGNWMKLSSEQNSVFGKSKSSHKQKQPR